MVTETFGRPEKEKKLYVGPQGVVSPQMEQLEVRGRECLAWFAQQEIKLTKKCEAIKPKSNSRLKAALMRPHVAIWHSGHSIPGLP